MRCIAMAYSREPLERVVNGMDQRVVYLVNPSLEHAIKNDPGIGVGFPTEFVFEYDATMFEKLLDAYRAADSTALESLWKKTKPLRLKLISE